MEMDTLQPLLCEHVIILSYTTSGSFTAYHFVPNGRSIYVFRVFKLNNASLGMDSLKSSGRYFFHLKKIEAFSMLFWHWDQL